MQHGKRIKCVGNGAKFAKLFLTRRQMCAISNMKKFIDGRAEKMKSCLIGCGTALTMPRLALFLRNGRLNASI